MRIAIVTKHDRAAIMREAEQHGLTVAGSNPDAVLCYGGDGTFLHAEREYPGVPKLLVRKSDICKSCHTDSVEDALQALQDGTYETLTHTTLEARAGTEVLRGANDIILRNANLHHAIRFSLAIGGQVIHGRVIGDGLVVATPFGSSAYYRSITGDTFEAGFGIAFNNTTGDEEHLLVDEDAEITVTILRGPADLAADNERLERSLNDGDTITISRSHTSARILVPR